MILRSAQNLNVKTFVSRDDLKKLFHAIRLLNATGSKLKMSFIFGNGSEFLYAVPERIGYYDIHTGYIEMENVRLVSDKKDAVRLPERFEARYTVRDLNIQYLEVE